MVLHFYVCHFQRPLYVIYFHLSYRPIEASGLRKVRPRPVMHGLELMVIYRERVAISVYLSFFNLSLGYFVISYVNMSLILLLNISISIISIQCGVSKPILTV